MINPTQRGNLTRVMHFIQWERTKFDMAEWVRCPLELTQCREDIKIETVAMHCDTVVCIGGAVFILFSDPGESWHDADLRRKAPWYEEILGLDGTQQYALFYGLWYKSMTNDGTVGLHALTTQLTELGQRLAAINVLESLIEATSDEEIDAILNTHRYTNRM